MFYKPTPSNSLALSFLKSACQRLALFVLALVASTLLVSVNSYSANLTAPFAFDSAATLPKGVRNVRLIGMTTEAKTIFDENGNAQPLGSNTMARSISYGEMIDALPDANERADYRGILASRGISLNESAGDSTGIVTARVTVGLPVLAYGVTDNWTVALAVPIVRSTFKMNSGFKARENFANLQAQLYQEGYRDEMNRVSQMTQDVFRHINDTGGYGPIQNETRTDVGDINLVNKYKFYQSEDMAAAIIGTVIFPTGRQSDPHRMVDIGSGDDAWSVGAGLVTDYYLSGRWTATAAVNYIAQLPDHYPRHLPQKPDFNMSRDFDGDLQRDRGDIVRSSLGAKYRAFEDWTLGSAYGLSYKGQDTFSGESYPQYRYNFLEFNSEQVLHTGMLGVSYSTVNKYRRQAALLPFEVNANYATPIAGRNVGRDELVTLEVVAYF